MLKRSTPPQPIPPSAPPLSGPPPKAEDRTTPAEVRIEPRDTGNKLIVGPNIKLKGSEITDCDILLVEGRVEASMQSRHMHIAEGGIFVGVAEIDSAEIRGAFEGELIARKRLVIHATGRVSGKIRYGALTVEEGGTLSGELGGLGASTHGPEAPGGEHRAETPRPDPRPALTAALASRGALTSG